jgi:hypothetical protein
MIADIYYLIPLYRWKIPTLTFIDSVINLITTIIALVIGLYAYKGYLLTREKKLLHINISFTVIGGGILVEAILNFLAVISRAPSLFIIGESVSMTAQILGYLILLYTYYRPGIIEEEAVVGASLLILEGIRKGRVLYGYLILAIIVIFILYRLSLNLIVKKDVGALLSFTAFTVLEASYLLFTLSLYNIRLYFVGELFRMTGFVILAILLYIISRGAERRL